MDAGTTQPNLQDLEEFSEIQMVMGVGLLWKNSYATLAWNPNSREYIEA